MCWLTQPEDDSAATSSHKTIKPTWIKKRIKQDAGQDNVLGQPVCPQVYQKPSWWDIPTFFGHEKWSLEIFKQEKGLEFSELQLLGTYIIKNWRILNLESEMGRCPVQPPGPCMYRHQGQTSSQQDV